MIRQSIIGKRNEFACAALHLGGVDFYCALRDFSAPAQFHAAGDKLWAKFRTASLPTMIRLVNEEFGPDEFGLEDVLPDGRLAISGMIFGGLLEGLTDQFAPEPDFRSCRDERSPHCGSRSKKGDRGARESLNRAC